MYYLNSEKKSEKNPNILIQVYLSSKKGLTSYKLPECASQWAAKITSHRLLTLWIRTVLQAEINLFFDNQSLFSGKLVFVPANGHWDVSLCNTWYHILWYEWFPWTVARIFFLVLKKYNNPFTGTKRPTHIPAWQCHYV